MIDLISHGLDLRRKLIISSEENPQIIRNVSARSNPYLSIDSAISSESAAGSKNTLIDGAEEVLKITTDANLAYIAEQQTIQGDAIADELRSDCGLDKSIPVNKVPINLLKTVSCNDCEHFSPDQIGDGTGIGSCDLGIRSTKIAGYITMPLYRYSDRYCDKFSKLIK